MPRLSLEREDLEQLRSSADEAIDDILMEAVREEPNNIVFKALKRKRDLIRKVDRALMGLEE